MEGFRVWGHEEKRFLGFCYVNMYGTIFQLQSDEMVLLDGKKNTVDMQLGYPDKNGKQMFDRDICWVHENENNDDFIVSILWNPLELRFDFICYEMGEEEHYEIQTSDNWTAIDHFEVIGNCHENNLPELWSKCMVKEKRGSRIE